MLGFNTKNVHSTEIWKGAKVILLILVLSLSLSKSQIVPISNSNYNQQCLHANQCNNKAGLYCIPVGPGGQLRCGCPTNNTIFDEYQGRCVGKVGYPCIYQGNESFCPEKAHCTHQDPHHPDLYFYESRCFCDINYFGNKQGKCVLAAKYGESCSSSNKKCDEVSGLKCTNGKCTCAFGPDQQYYDGKKDKCVSYIGKKCSGYHSCVDNARCDGISISRVRTDSLGASSTNNILFASSSIASRSISSNRSTGSSRNSINTGSSNIGSKSQSDVEKVGVCACEYGFLETNGKCLAGYRQSCSETQRCSVQHNLQCLDGTCNCKSLMNQIYNHTLKTCVNLVGGKCNGNSRNTCVENAQCINGVCMCHEGFSKTPYRRCMKDYSQPCQNGQCNLFNGLSCTSKKCSCMDDSLIYNKEIQACISQIGHPCGKIGQTGDYGKESFYISCEPLAICKQEPGGDSSTMFCRLPDKDL